MMFRWCCLEQLPQERTRLPKSETWNFVRASWHAPLSWKTWPSAFFTPPPSTSWKW